MVTTHGEDFLKNLENQISTKNLKKTLSRYDFLENSDNRDIIVIPDLNRHYLSTAQNNLKFGFSKDCLMECRRSLEELSDNLWKKLAKQGLDSSISLKLRSAKQKPELSNLVDGLISRLKEFEKTDIIIFQEHRETLEKIKNAGNKHQIFWNLLNKGTHEEERSEEFDQNSINELLKHLLKLEELLKSTK